MNTEAIQPEAFTGLAQTATRLGVPAAWLRAEAMAGRLPHLRAGRRLLFNLPAVENALIDRARQQADGATDAD